MNLQEIVIKSNREPESLRQSDDESDVTLTQFHDEDTLDPHLAELCAELVGLTSPGQIRAVLSLYLPELKWGGVQV